MCQRGMPTATENGRCWWKIALEKLEKKLMGGWHPPPFPPPPSCTPEGFIRTEILRLLLILLFLCLYLYFKSARCFLGGISSGLLYFSHLSAGKGYLHCIHRQSSNYLWGVCFILDCHKSWKWIKRYWIYLRWLGSSQCLAQFFR